MSERQWTDAGRPGYFGRRRDEKIAALNAEHGAGNWRLAWKWGLGGRGFFCACREFYEESYFAFFLLRPDEVDFVCSFGEVIDCAPSNVSSGLDYARQESYATHIQDIAVRSVLRRLGRWFEGPTDSLLTIRGPESNGARFNPGRIPFAWPNMILAPSLAPKWADPGSVEDFWQSNKILQVAR